MCTWLHWQLARRCQREIRASSAKGYKGKTVPVWATATQRCREGGVWVKPQGKTGPSCVRGMSLACRQQVIRTYFPHADVHICPHPLPSLGRAQPQVLCLHSSAAEAVLDQQSASSRELQEHPHSPQAMLHKGPFAMPTCFFCLRLEFHNTAATKAGFPGFCKPLGLFSDFLSEILASSLVLEDCGVQRTQNCPWSTAAETILKMQNPKCKRGKKSFYLARCFRKQKSNSKAWFLDFMWNHKRVISHHSSVLLDSVDHFLSLKFTTCIHSGQHLHF